MHPWPDKSRGLVTEVCPYLLNLGEHDGSVCNAVRVTMLVFEVGGSTKISPRSREEDQNVDKEPHASTL